MGLKSGMKLLEIGPSANPADAHDHRHWPPALDYTVIDTSELPLPVETTCARFERVRGAWQTALPSLAETRPSEFDAVVVLLPSALYFGDADEAPLARGLRTALRLQRPRAEWRAAFSQRVLPALRAFTPDLLLISAGFDGGCNDVGNGKQDSNEKLHQGLDLTPADFEWATAELLRVAAVCCPGRVVSLLEGGYGAYEFSKTSATGWTISRAQLGENAAAHASALVGVSRVHH